MTQRRTRAIHTLLVLETKILLALVGGDAEGGSLRELF